MAQKPKVTTDIAAADATMVDVCFLDSVHHDGVAYGIGDVTRLPADVAEQLSKMAIAICLAPDAAPADATKPAADIAPPSEV